MRHESKNVEYFPCYCKDGKVLYILESRWGNNGWAFFYKLWKRLGDSDFHYIDLRPLDNWEYFRAKMGVSDAETTEILDKLAEMKVIDPEMWSHRIIWSDSFVESVSDVWMKRKGKIPQKPSFLIQKQEFPERKSAETIISVAEVHKGKDSIVKNRKVKNICKTSMPDNFTVSEKVKSWASEKGFDRLDEHLEAFKLSCESRGYKYTNWDAAFMRAVRDDWARLRSGNGNRASPQNRHGGIMEWLSEKQLETDDGKTRSS